MYTVGYRLYNKAIGKWYHDTIQTEDWDRALEHFYWFSDMAKDPDVTDAHITLSAEKHTCCRYTKSDNPVW
jgi:hypothetical protein